MGISQKILSLDYFGIPLQLRYKNEKQFRSLFGVISTICIYTLCAIYSIYIFYQWIDWQILPKVQTQMKTVKTAEVNLDEGFITFGYFNDTTFDPFSENNNILLPLLFKVNNTDVEVEKVLFSKPTQVNYASDLRPQVVLPQINLTLVKDANNYNQINQAKHYEISYMIFIVYCDEKYLIGTNGTCASKELISEFKQSGVSTLDLNINLKSYNIVTKQFEYIQKSLYFAIVNENKLFSQVMIKSAIQTINKGIIFDNLQTQTFVNDVDLVQDYIKNNFSNINTQYNYTFEFFIKLDNTQTVENIAYNKLGEILAEIGSIIQMILITQYIFLTINENMLDQQLIDDIIKYYHPELKCMKITKSIFGRVKLITNFEKTKKFDNYKKYYNAMQPIIIEKQNINNIIKEIISIQNFIQNTFGQNISIINNQIEAANQLLIDKIDSEDIYQDPKLLLNSIRSINSDEQIQKVKKSEFNAKFKNTDDKLE